MAKYDVRSPRADEFINHEEIMDTLAYAEAHKDDVELARSILQKARANLTPAHDHGTTLTHREASVLLACDDDAMNAEIRQLARDIKQAYYGNRVVLFAPLTFQLLRERLLVLPLSCEEPRDSAPQAYPGGNPRRGGGPAGYGP